MRFLLSLSLAIVFVWCAGFTWFVASMPKTVISSTIKTDAIIVLTGGNGRVERGFEMFGEGAAPLLFISGVGSQVTLREMLALHTLRETRKKVNHVMRQQGASVLLGQSATTTRTNAEEVAEFTREHALKSIRLVTAHYHMARARLEFQRELPGITLVADSVFPAGFRRGEWWRHDNTRRLMLSEYHKYLAASFGLTR